MAVHIHPVGIGIGIDAVLVTGNRHTREEFYCRSYWIGITLVYNSLVNSLGARSRQCVVKIGYSSVDVFPVREDIEF